MLILHGTEKGLLMKFEMLDLAMDGTQRINQNVLWCF